MSENDKHQSGWYESNEGHAFHAHGQDMSQETLAALKKLADIAYAHLDSLPDDESEEDDEDVCRNCGQVKELVPDTPFCKICYVMLDGEDDEIDDDDFDPEFDSLDDADYCPDCGHLMVCCECEADDDNEDA